MTAAGKKMNETLSQLQLKGDVFTRQMVVEKKRLMDLEEAIAEAETQILANQKKVQQEAVRCCPVVAVS